MRFFSLVLFALPICASAQQEDDWLTAVIDQQKAEQQQMQQRGEFDRFDPERVQNDISSYLEEARAIAEDSHVSATEQQRIANEAFGETASDINVIPAQVTSSTVSSVPADTQSTKTLSAVFVSFSMTDNEIREAFIAADEAGAEVYFNGMHDEDESFIDTMSRIRSIMADSDARPRARFHPKAFTELNVTQVPMILVATRGNVAYATGTLSFDWLKRNMAGLSGVTDYGLMGPVNEVAEDNIIHELQRRLQNVDMESRKQAAVDNFWRKRDFVDIPNATETKTFYINPTVKVSQDIVNPNGDVLARAGQVLNPLTTTPTYSEYYLFNANEPDHVQWALSHVDRTYTQGSQMFMTSELDPDNGWDQLNGLRRDFGSELYLIPKELIERFKVSALPTIISTDLKKGLLKIQQINLQEASQ